MGVFDFLNFNPKQDTPDLSSGVGGGGMDDFYTPSSDPSPDSLEGALTRRNRIFKSLGVTLPPGADSDYGSVQDLSSASPQPNSGPRDYISALQQARNSGTGFNPQRTYDPNSQDVLDYKAALSRPPASEGILQNYLSSMPERSQYAPGVGRKIAGFLLGTLAGGGSGGGAYSATDKFLNTPYLNALQDWKQEGTSVQNRARLADAAQGRELAGMKFGIDNGIKSLKQANTDDLNNAKLTGTIANRTTKYNFDAARLAETQDENKRRQQRFDDTQDRLHEFHDDSQDLAQQRINDAEDREADLAGTRGVTGRGRSITPNQADTDARRALETNLRTEALRAGFNFPPNTKLGDIAYRLEQNKVINDPRFKNLFDNKGEFLQDVDPGLRNAIKDMILRNTRARFGGN